MSLRDRLFGRSPQQETLTLRDVVDRYDVVEVVSGSEDHGPFVVVTDRSPVSEGSGVRFAEPSDVDLREIGSASTSPYTGGLREDYNGELRGEMGLRKYDQMRRSDGTVRGTLRQIKTPVLGARWFIKPASDSTRDRAIADFVWKCLNDYMSISFTQVLTESMLMFDFGYYMFEKVYDIRVINGKERVVWRKLAPRHPADVQEWLWDSKGGPAGVVMYGADGQSVDIPISKLLVFSFDREAGNIMGISVLRSAYKHWYYKDQLYKIDAIQKERHGIGVPVIKLPPGFTKADKEAAEELGRNLRTNERAHVVLPPNWDLTFAKIEGQPVNALESIEHHDLKIKSNVLGDYLDKGGTGETGQDLFLKATRFSAAIIADSFNLYAIPQLVDFNYMRLPNGYPKLLARRIGETEDQRTLSFTVRNMVGAGVIKPDDRLEDFVREELDLPPRDPATAREIVIDHAKEEEVMTQQEQQQRQRGQLAGTPRQQPTPPVAPPRRNAGVDRSGG